MDLVISPMSCCCMLPASPPRYLDQVPSGVHETRVQFYHSSVLIPVIYSKPISFPYQVRKYQKTMHHGHHSAFSICIPYPCHWLLVRVFV